MAGSSKATPAPTIHLLILLTQGIVLFLDNKAFKYMAIGVAYSNHYIPLPGLHRLVVRFHKAEMHVVQFLKVPAAYHSPNTV